METARNIPTFKFKDKIGIRLSVSDPSGVARVEARFTSTGTTNPHSFYRSIEVGGEKESEPVIEIEVDDSLSPNDYRCEYLFLTDIEGNTTLVPNPGIEFRIEGIPGDHRGPELSDWRFVTA